MSSLDGGSDIISFAADCFEGIGVLDRLGGMLFLDGLVLVSWASTLVARADRGAGLVTLVEVNSSNESSLVPDERSERFGSEDGEGSRGTHTVLRRREIRAVLTTFVNKEKNKIK